MLALYNIACIRGQSLRLEYGKSRLAFASDTQREAILPDAGDKSGVWFHAVLPRAPSARPAERFDRHLARLAKEGGS